MRVLASTLALLFATLPAGVVMSSASAELPAKPTMAQKIDSIAAQVGDLSESDEGLWVNKRHKEMVDHPVMYRADIESFLAGSRDLPEDKVRVAVLALQCLPLDAYLAFVTKMSSLPKGKTGEWALFDSIIPGEEWSTRLQVDFKDPNVRATLETASKSPNSTKRLQLAIAHILDGTYAANIERSKDAPVLKCRAETKSPSR